MTLRLDEGVFADLHFVCDILDVPVSEFIREALKEHIEKIALDPEFSDKIHGQMKNSEAYLQDPYEKDD